MSHKNTAKKSVEIPVKVLNIPSNTPARPPVAMPPLSSQTPMPKPASQITRFKKSVKQIGRPVIPEDRRRRIMWALVATATVVILTGWGLTWRGQFTFQGDNSIFAELARTFKGFSVANNKDQQVNSEIQDLTNQIFPQFKNLQ